jgi:polyphosphate kinase
MMRNLEHRVEVLVPVEGADLRAELRQILDTHLADHRNAWDMRSDGTYVQRRPSDENSKGGQEAFVQLAYERLKASQRLKRRKPQGIGRRNIK